MIFIKLKQNIVVNVADIIAICPVTGSNNVKAKILLKDTAQDLNTEETVEELFYILQFRKNGDENWAIVKDNIKIDNG
jgi:hypothetical protein